MTHTQRTSPRRLLFRYRVLLIFIAAVACALTSLSAHAIRGLGNPDQARALVSSPSAGDDLVVPIKWATDTGLRVACFNVANSSPPRADNPNYPRITAVGFELIGNGSGFALVSPLDGNWDLVEDVTAVLADHGRVKVDIALVARVKPLLWFLKGHHGLPGLAPGQPEARGSGTRFCVSGPFRNQPEKPAPPDDPLHAIEDIINGVLVRFDGLQDRRFPTDVGVWTTAAGPRPIPLFP